ncbi:MAG: MazG family protein [Eubacteriales bacterium]|nr:MazG family protein [Eubacteriales bacterium]
MYSYTELLDIIATLRGEGGCPWDKAQTHESLIPCLRDECEEVVQAIGEQDDENLCEELGDVLLQVLLHAQIASEEGRFTIGDVVNGLAEKMIRRHPHVFGDEEYGSPEQNKARWEEIKRQEKEAKKKRKTAQNQA